MSICIQQGGTRGRSQGLHGAGLASEPAVFSWVVPVPALDLRVLVVILPVEPVLKSLTLLV